MSVIIIKAYNSTVLRSIGQNTVIGGQLLYNIMLASATHTTNQPQVYIYVPSLLKLLYTTNEYSFVVYSEVRELHSSSSISISQDYFGYSGSFVSPYKFSDFFFSSVKNATGNLKGITLNL